MRIPCFSTVSGPLSQAFWLGLCFRWVRGFVPLFSVDMRTYFLIPPVLSSFLLAIFLYLEPVWVAFSRPDVEQLDFP